MKKIFIILLLFSSIVGLILSSKSQIFNDTIKFINVCDYGANGYDNIDDTDAINKALSSFTSHNKTIYFPDGKYIVKNLNIPSNTHIIGQSKSTVLQISSTSNTWDKLIYLNKGNRITIDSITFDGNIENTYGNTEEGVFLLKIDDSKNINIINCQFQNNKYCSIVIRGNKNINIDNCKFFDTDVGVCFMDNQSKNCIISNNYFEGGTSEAIALYGRFNGYFKNFEIFNNVVKDKTAGHGIHIRQSKNVNVYDNNIYNCGIGITVEKYNQYGCDSVSIKNNTIDTTSIEGINVKTDNVTIDSNNIINTGESAILILDVDNVNIINNTIEDFNILNKIEGQGIHSENMTNSVIKNNKFSLNNTSDIKSKSYIFLSGICNNNVISNNIFYPWSIDLIHDFSQNR